MVKQKPPEIYWTSRQIIQKAGRDHICGTLDVSRDATRKWYIHGIPGKHWMKLVKTYDWLTYQMLEQSSEICAAPDRFERFKKKHGGSST